MIATSNGLLALGQDKIPRAGLPPRTNGVVWRSKSGARWSDIATIKNALVTDLASSHDGLLVVGTQAAKDGRRAPSVWSSTDGMAWQRQTLDREGPPPIAVAVSDAGVLLVLGHKIRDDLSTTTRLWRSEDGRSWDQVALPGGLSEDERIRLHGPVSTPSGFLLFVGEEVGLGETLWRSDTGLDWERVPLPEDWSLSRSWVIAQPWPRESVVISARAFPGYLAMPWLLLTSDGGLTWCRSDGPRVVPFTASDAAAGPDGSLLMVGSSTALDPSVWTVRWMPDSVVAKDGEAFRCEPLPASHIMG
jgi:hypothetical protein